MLHRLRRLAGFFQLGPQFVNVVDCEFGNAFLPQHGRNMQVEANAVILDCAIGAFVSSNKFHKRVKVYLLSSACLAAAALARFSLLLASFPSMRSPRMLEALAAVMLSRYWPPTFFLNEFSVFAITDVIDLLKPLSSRAGGFDKIHSSITYNRLPFSAGHGFHLHSGPYAPHLWRKKWG